MPEAILDLAKAEMPFSAAQCLSAVARAHGKSPMAQVRDYIRLRLGPGRLSLREYYQFRLYDDTRHSPEAKRQFLGYQAQQRLYARHIPMHWRAIAGDKIVFYALFTGLGLPVPRTRALFHPRRGFATAVPLRNRAALAAYLRDPGHYPLFGKPVDGMFSVGVVSADGYDGDADTVILSGGRNIPIDSLVAAASEYFDGGYLLQQRLEPHPELASISGRGISTVRLMVMLGAEGPEIYQALWKITGNGNIADNFWRAGNMLASLDIASGTVQRVVRGEGPAQETLTAHPDTGKRLEGYVLPQWDAVTALCREAAAAIPGLPLQAWDIAICSNGPVLVEANIGGDVNLPQIAAGKGIMGARLSDFLAA